MREFQTKLAFPVPSAEERREATNFPFPPTTCDKVIFERKEMEG